ncbi:MAG: phosphate ABC transporter ATP-binding protein, partial [Pseudomonadales bacterium]|nr:phosphate ABC transporter ATP-binding protein [Pseudomonadales bacterium]
MSALGRSQQELNMDKESIALEVPGLSLFYDTKQALHDVSIKIPRNRVT